MSCRPTAAASKAGVAAGTETLFVRSVRAVAAYWLIVVILAGLLLYLQSLGQRTIYVEEGRRAIQAINLLHGGSWWLLEVGGEPYVAKPPLLPWLIALASFITGAVNEWSVRLPSVFFTIIAAVAAGGIARLLVGDHGPQRRDIAALAAGLAFLCSPIVIERARIGETDLAATGTTAIAFLLFAAAWKRERLSIWIWLGVATALAGGALAKGPIPVAFAVIPILATVSIVRPRRHLASALLTIVLAFVPLAAWAHLNFSGHEIEIWLDETRVADVVELGRLDGLLPLLYLNQLPRWLLSLLPWVAFAAVYVWQQRRELGRNKLLLAVLLYAVPMALIVLIWPGGRGRYALPAVVPVSALAGAAIALYWERALVRRIFATFTALLAMAALFYNTVLTGRSGSQAAARTNIAALTKVLAERVGGRLLAIAPDYNLLIYAQRPVQAVSVAALSCAAPSDTLIVPKLINTDGSAWIPIGPIGSSDFVALRPSGTERPCAPETARNVR